jgi:hypothetical protein
MDPDNTKVVIKCNLAELREFLNDPAYDAPETNGQIPVTATAFLSRMGQIQVVRDRGAHMQRPSHGS